MWLTCAIFICLEINYKRLIKPSNKSICPDTKELRDCPSFIFSFFFGLSLFYLCSYFFFAYFLHKFALLPLKCIVLETNGNYSILLLLHN